jgi:hypothetical protein
MKMGSLRLKNTVQFLKEPLLIDKILQEWRVEVGLQDAVGTIHGAVGSDMEDLVAATDIRFRAGTFSQKGPLVACKKEHTFSCSYRVLHGSKGLMDLYCVRHNRDRDAREGLPDSANSGMLANRFINVQLGNHRR